MIRNVMKGIALLIAAAMVATSLTSLPACSSDKGGEAKRQGREKTPLSPAATGAARKASAAKDSGKAGKIGPEVKKEEEKEVYSYKLIRADGKTKRDPFTPIRISELTPIRSYDISQLKVNGVIMHGKKTANVVTPSGDATRVHIGDKIGIHDGVVVDITLEGVKVKETYLDAKGRIQEIERFIENQ